MCAWKESNLRPPQCQCDALTTELHALVTIRFALNPDHAMRGWICCSAIAPHSQKSDLFAHCTVPGPKVGTVCSLELQIFGSLLRTEKL